MDAPDTIKLLAGLPAFAGVNVSALTKIAACCRPMSRRAEENLFLEGDPCRGLYILVAGRLKCYRTSPEGREQILKVLERPGEIFCTTAAFSTGSHIVTADAMTDISLQAIDVETMRRVALEEPALALALVSTAGDQMRGLVGLADDLSLKTAMTRVAKLLCQRAREKGTCNGKDIHLLRESLREEEIAAMVGTVPVHVSRSLKALAKMGAITITRAAIRIADLKALERLSGGAEAERRR
jgi:CRP/FNR family transcriptional regulator